MNLYSKGHPLLRMALLFMKQSVKIHFPPCAGYGLVGGAEAVWLPLPWFHHRAIPVTSVAAYARKKGSRAWPHDVYGLLLWTPDSRGES